MTKVAVLGLTGVLLGLMMKELNPGFSVFVSMAACVLIFFGFHGESMPGCGLFRHRGAGGIFREDFSSDLKLSCAYGTDGNH